MIDTSSHRIPIRTEIDELAIFPNGTTETYKFSYNFFHWKAHQPDASHFVPHGNQICKSKDHNSSQPIPSFPENYSTGIEFTIINKNYTGFMNEYYDHSNNRIAIDLNFGGTHVQSIILLDDQIEYIVTNESRCVTRKYNENNFFGGSLQSSSEFLHFGKQFQEEYQGMYLFLYFIFILSKSFFLILKNYKYFKKLLLFNFIIFIEDFIIIYLFIIIIIYFISNFIYLIIFIFLYVF